MDNNNYYLAKNSLMALYGQPKYKGVNNSVHNILSN